MRRSGAGVHRRHELAVRQLVAGELVVTITLGTYRRPLSRRRKNFLVATGKIDPESANRRRLLTSRERLSHNNFTKMWNALVAEDPSAQILSAWIAKEELRT